MGRKRLVIVDADTLAGWRRASPSLAQLWEAVDDLHDQEPGATVAVVADPSLKWALDSVEQESIEGDITSRRLVCAPAGCDGGHRGFITGIVDRARELGYDSIVVTDQNLPGMPLGTARRTEGTWVFNLDGHQASIVAPEQPGGGGRRRRSRKK